jgi:hypothetical protein
MAVISTTTKGKAGVKGAKALAKRPQLLANGAKAAVPAGRFALKARKPALKVGKPALKAGKPVLKRKARKRADQIEDAARRFGEALAVYGPQAAYELGLAEPPKPKRTAPRVVAGIVIGASAMYFLEPGQGSERRKKVVELVG